jgi:Holliday junction resolvasome RuvABC endonuclease subunit
MKKKQLPDITLIGCDPGRQHTALCAVSVRTGDVIGNLTINVSLASARKQADFNPSWYRLEIMREEAKVFISQFENPVGIIEEYIYLGKMTKEEYETMDRSPLQLAETHGALYCAFASLGVPSVKLSVTLVKFFLTGDGVADKRKMIKEGFRIYNTALDDEHQFDALCMAHVGRHLVSFCVNPTNFDNKGYAFHSLSNLIMEPRHKGVQAAIINMLRGEKQ